MDDTVYYVTARASSNMQLINEVEPSRTASSNRECSGVITVSRAPSHTQEVIYLPSSEPFLSNR